MVKLFLHEINARQDAEARGDLVAGFAEGLLPYHARPGQWLLNM